MRHLWIFAPAVLGMLGMFGIESSEAQSRGGMNAGRSYGQMSRGQGSFGQGSRGAFGNPVGSGQSRGGAGYGTNAFGSPGSGFGGGFGNNRSGFGQQGFGQQGIGTNQIGAGLAGDRFIGNDAADTQNFFRNMNRGGQRPGAMLDFMIENLNDMRDRGGRGNGEDRTPPVRVKLRPAFETPLGTMRQVSTKLESRLLSSATDLGITDVKISMEGRILTLEGTVATEHQRDLAEAMISLEPGVSSVDNRLVVEPAAE